MFIEPERHSCLFFRCEPFNATVRAQNIYTYSNRLSPSRDICHHFAVQQHLCYLCDAPSSGDVRYAKRDNSCIGIRNNVSLIYRCGDALTRMSPMMQHFFYNVLIEELNAGRSMHRPGALRKVSTPICTYIRYIYIMFRSKYSQMLKHINLGIVGLSYPTTCIEGLQNDQGVNISASALPT